MGNRETPKSPHEKDSKWQGTRCGLDGCSLPAWHLGVCAVAVEGARSRHQIDKFTYVRPVSSSKGKKMIPKPVAAAQKHMKGRTSSNQDNQAVKEMSGKSQKRKKAPVDPFAFVVEEVKPRAKPKKKNDDPFAFEEEDFEEIARQRLSALRR